MTPIMDLDQNLATLDPRVEGSYIFDCVDAIPHGLEPFVTVREAEGITVVVTEAEAREFGLATDAIFTRISLGAYTDLAAIGITATVSQTLASRAIPCNVIAGFHHDHLFVPKGKSKEALQLLTELTRHAQGWLPPQSR